MATEATVRSNAYQNALQSLDAGLEVFAVACPRLAPLIQDGECSQRRLSGAARECVAPLKAARVDTVILGCTHYPLITPMLRRLLGPQVALINSAEETAREVGEIMVRKGIGNDEQAGKATIVSSRAAIRKNSERWARASCSFLSGRCAAYDQRESDRELADRLRCASQDHS